MKKKNNQEEAPEVQALEQAIQTLNKLESLHTKSTAAHDKILQKIVTRFENLVKNFQKQTQKQEKFLTDVAGTFQKFSDQVESWEDGLMLVMHNIKKNQFLYSHYPEDWVKDYLSVKQGIEYENLFMDKKISEKEVAR